MTDNTWKDYFQKTKNSPPRRLLVKALPYVKERGMAIDLGSGALNDSLYLLDGGFKKVIALDKEALAKELAVNLSEERFEYVISPFESFDFPEGKFDLVNAQYALPFIVPHQFEAVFQKIDFSLKKEGVFVGQFFGDRDQWVSSGKMTFHTKEEAERLLSGFETFYFKEEEEYKPTAAGDIKHWHVFHFIVKKM